MIPAALALLLLSPAAASPAAPAPPDEFAMKDECAHGRWSVLQSAVLLEKPHGRKIGKLREGEKVDVLAGEVRTHPRPYRVVAKHDAFSPGNVVYEVWDAGNGRARYWKDGAMTEDDSPAVCGLKLGAKCWLSPLDKPFDPAERVRWAKVQASPERGGWVVVTDVLKPLKPCGDQ